jgi:hypothetical protein
LENGKLGRGRVLAQRRLRKSTEYTEKEKRSESRDAEGAEKSTARSNCATWGD